MAEQTPKPTTKKTVKRPQTPKTTPQELRIVVEQQTPIISEDKALEPIKEGNKLSIAQTWVTQKQSLRIMQRTPKEYIYTRPGKGGQTFSYVPVNYVTKVLNFVFGWNWDFIIDSEQIHGLMEGWGQVIVKGRLVVKNTDGSSTITKMQFGQAEVKYLTETEAGTNKKVRTGKPVNLGNDFKAAASDALKKCASELGIASDVYGVNEYREVKADEEQPPENIIEAIKAMISKASNAGVLKALNISVGNAKITDDEKQTLYDLIEAKASGFATS